eukprot:TRINITY_DN409_c1_g1_i1.p1 TRINITY_DN409_c1_g1~~TRINITY_DN409_c1_g1_i1.p1  ORF type:complete len:729 (+),score=147.59 TRINITY_DN409_c1_g1_i1:174-2360(+)
MRRSGTATSSTTWGGSGRRIKREEREELTVTEFRARVLSSVNKLNKRETSQQGTNELLFILDQLNPNEDSLSIFMNCLLDTNEAQTSAFRKEILKLITTAAGIYQQDLLPFLPKMVSTISKFLKDKDTSFKTDCSHALGIIAANVVPNEDTKDPMDVYFKPLFQHFSEQNKNQQSGAAICIASVISSSLENHVSSCIAEMITRVQKMLVSPSCVAKAGLYHVLAALAQKCPELTLKYIPSIIFATSDGFGSNDWLDRKAAAEAIVILARTFRQALSPYKESLLDLLEKAKFDQMKPTRDAVVAALNAVQYLPDPELGTTIPKQRGMSLTKKKSARSSSVISSGRSQVSDREFDGISLETSPHRTERSRSLREVPHIIYANTNGNAEDENRKEGGFFSSDERESQRGFENMPDQQKPQKAQVEPSFFVPVSSQRSKRNERTDKESLLTIEDLGDGINRRSSLTSGGQNQSVTIQQYNVLAEQFKQLTSIFETISLQNKGFVDEIRSLKERVENLERKSRPSTREGLLSVPSERSPSTKSPNQLFNSQKSSPIGSFEKDVLNGSFTSSRKDPFQYDMTPRNNHLQSTTIRESSIHNHQIDETWQNVIDNCSIGNVDGAYRIILEDGDTLQLFRLIEKTGPVLDSLQADTSTELFLRFISLLKNNKFVEDIFPWIEQALHRSLLPISSNQINQLKTILQNFTANPNNIGIESNRLLDQLRRHIAKLPHSYS